MTLKRRGLLFILAFLLDVARLCLPFYIAIIIKYATYMRSQLPSQYSIGFRLHTTSSILIVDIDILHVL